MKIAIVKLSALGDIVHSMIILQVIKKHVKNVTIDWIVEENLKNILEYNPHIDHIKTVNLKSLKRNKPAVFEEIKKIRSYANTKYDLVIDLQGLIKSAIAAKLLSKNTAGFDKNSLREKAASYLYKKTYYVPYEENIIKRNCILISKALGFEFDENDIKEKDVFLFFKNFHKETIFKNMDQNKKNIVLILGSSWQSKVYPKEKFLAIANYFEHENVLLVWGSDEEQGRAEFIAKHSKANIAPKMDLNELKALISDVDLVIGGDSGPTHIAWALNVKSITIYGPTPSFRNSYITDKNVTIDCAKTIDPNNLNKQDFCIKEIDEMKIIKLAEKLLYG